MVAPFDPSTLPAHVRGLVERALSEREGHDEAIRAIEAHLEAGGERSPDLLVALATVTYDDAAAVVLHRLGEASAQALALLDEAARARGSEAGLEPLRDAFLAAQAREQARERRLRMLLLAPERARPTELAQLAHQVLLDGEDRAAHALMREASRLDDEAEDAADDELRREAG